MSFAYHLELVLIEMDDTAFGLFFFFNIVIYFREHAGGGGGGREGG